MYATWQANPEPIVAFTVKAIVVVAVVDPEVPVIVTVDAPAVAVLLAVSVNTLEPVVGLVPNAAVTPLGRPEAARVTLPVNPPTSVTAIVSVALAPSAIERVGDELLSVNPGLAAALTVSAMVVVAVVDPDVPVIVTVAGPVVAVLLAVSVNTLVPVAGLVPSAAVTPLGRPEAARVTPPVKPPTSVTEIVSVALAPCATDMLDADGASVKPGLAAALIVTAMVVVAVVDPEVPVIVIVAVPVVAVLLAVSVTTLAPVVGLVPNAAVTPLGSPETATVTLPVNPPVSVTVMVSVAVLPWITDIVEAEGVSVKPAGGVVEVGVPVPITMPRPFVPTYTVPNVCGSPVMTPFKSPPYWCAESLICSQLAPSLVEAKMPKAPPTSPEMKTVG